MTPLELAAWRRRNAHVERLSAMEKAYSNTCRTQMDLDVYEAEKNRVSAEYEAREVLIRRDLVEAGAAYPTDSERVTFTPKNLNAQGVRTDGRDSEPAPDNFIADGDIGVFFRDLIPRLLGIIEAHTVVVGCVAWFTHSDVIAALKGKKVSIVVQKEDFLRPDSNMRTQSKKRLRKGYAGLASSLTRRELGIGHVCEHTNQEPIDAVRCVGNHNWDKAPAAPRMHNKFLLFGHLDGPDQEFKPRIVWTGSFNITQNATNSLENALLIDRKSIVHEYYKEFQHILSLSEPLDWKSPWMAPEWRIGS